MTVILSNISTKKLVAIMVVLIAFIVIFVSSCMGPTIEQKQNEMKVVTTTLTKNIATLESLTAEWKTVWQNIAIGMMPFDQGANKLASIAIAAQEVSEVSAQVGVPKWLDNKPKEDLENLKKDISLSANALSVASNAGAQMLKTGKLTSADISTMAGYTKDANNYLGKTISMLNKFKSGYGITTDK